MAFVRHRRRDSTPSDGSTIRTASTFSRIAQGNGHFGAACPPSDPRGPPTLERRGCVSWNMSASGIRESKPRTARDRVLFGARGNASRNPCWPPQPLQSSLKGFKSNRVRAPNPQRPAQYPLSAVAKKDILALPPPPLRPLSPPHHAIHLHRHTDRHARTKSLTD